MCSDVDRTSRGLAGAKLIGYNMVCSGTKYIVRSIFIIHLSLYAFISSTNSPINVGQRCTQVVSDKDSRQVECLSTHTYILASIPKHGY